MNNTLINKLYSVNDFTSEEVLLLTRGLQAIDKSSLTTLPKINHELPYLDDACGITEKDLINMNNTLKCLFFESKSASDYIEKLENFTSPNLSKELLTRLIFLRFVVKKLDELKILDSKLDKE